MNSPNQRLKAVREELGYSQTEFAQMLGLDQSYLSAVEKGKKDMTYKLLTRLSHQFGISMHWIVDGEGEMKLNPKDQDSSNTSEKSTNENILENNIREVYVIPINEFDLFIKKTKAIKLNLV